MAFTPEDGSGLETANAYVTEQEYRDHHADRGVDVTQQSQAQVQAAIVQATDYADKRFGRRYRGWKQSRRQNLEWPRIDAYDDDDHLFEPVPKPLKRGVIDYAWLATQLAAGLAPVPGLSYPTLDPGTGEVTTQGGGAIQSKREKVGPIEESVTYTREGIAFKSTGNPLVTLLPEYPQADLWLEEVLRSDRRLVRG